MNHLKIEQGNNFADTEIVDNKIISKLYEVASEGLDETSNLKGRLSVPASYRSEVEYLTENYPDLIIISDDYAIPFEDSKMLAYLNSIGVGSDGMVTETQAAAATVVANSTNTEITKFNELRYFTNITESKGGFNDWVSGVISFNGWTALEEVDISNFITLGHVNSHSDTFFGCTSLKKVTASSKLTKLGNGAFGNCSNLEEITGLEGTISLSATVFYNCRKLKPSSFENVIFLLEGNNDGKCNSVFSDCKLLTTLTFSDDSTGRIEYDFCSGCTNLTTVTLPSNITFLGDQAFCDCTSLTTINIPQTLTTLGKNVFANCSNLVIEDLSLPNLTSLGSSAFQSTKIKSVSDLGSITSISRGTFYNCTSLTSITIPNSVTSIGNSAFENCTSLTSVVFPDTVVSIGTASFKNCTQIQHVTSLGIITSLTSEWLDQATFYRCTGLLDVVLPETLTTIGLYGFVGCSNIRYIKILATSVPTYNLVSGFGNTQSYGGFFGESYRNEDVTSEYLGYTYPIYVVDSLLEEYKVADGWKHVGACSNGYNLNLTERLKPLSQFATDFPNG